MQRQDATARTNNMIGCEQGSSGSGLSQVRGRSFSVSRSNLVGETSAVPHASRPPVRISAQEANVAFASSAASRLVSRGVPVRWEEEEFINGALDL